MAPRAAWRPNRWALAASLAIALSLGASACSSDDDGDRPSGDVPRGVVAEVGDAEISQQALDRRVAALRRAQRPASGAGGGSAAKGAPGAAGGPQPTEEERSHLEQQALAQMLRAEALEQEAAERGIEVEPAEARRRWKAAADAQFKTKKALRSFLGGQTEQDIVRELRLQILTERIHEQVREQADGNPDKAVRQFQQEFDRRWSERTACAKRFEISSCGDGA